MISATSYFGALNLPDVGTLVPSVTQQVFVAPATRMAQYAIVGAVFGGLLAATFGLAGGAIGPGNRTAVLGLLAIPVGGVVAGVLWAQHTYKDKP